MVRRVKQDNPLIKETSTAPSYTQCKVEVLGQRCKFPGTLHPGTTSPTSETGICRLHYGAPPEVHESVVRESELWFADITAGRDVPMTYKRHDGLEVPGFPSRRQIEAARTLEAMPDAQRSRLSREQITRALAEKVERIV